MVLVLRVRGTRVVLTIPPIVCLLKKYRSMDHGVEMVVGPCEAGTVVRVGTVVASVACRLHLALHLALASIESGEV